MPVIINLVRSVAWFAALAAVCWGFALNTSGQDGNELKRDDAANTATIERLRAFSRYVLGDDVDDAMCIRKLIELNEQVKDDQLRTVEAFALSEEGQPAAWVFARLLVDRNRVDSAANVIVTALISDKDDRRYRMWKWWEHTFGQRKDYKAISRKMTDALLRQFALGGAARKEVIAELFGKGKVEANLTADEFRRAIGYK